MRFGRLNPPQYDDRFKTFAMKITLRLSSIKQTKIFITEYYVIYLFVRKENKEAYFEAKFVNSYSYLMAWLFRLKLSQAERNSWWICKTQLINKTADWKRVTWCVSFITCENQLKETYFGSRLNEHIKCKHCLAMSPLIGQEEQGIVLGW